MKQYFMLSSLQAKQNSNLQIKITTIHRVSELKVRIKHLTHYLLFRKENPYNGVSISLLDIKFNGIREDFQSFYNLANSPDIVICNAEWIYAAIMTVEITRS
jgi:hypothetical protein